MRAGSLALVLLLAVGCGGAGAPPPRAIVVGPASDAGPAMSGSDDAARTADEIVPFEIVFGMNQVCARASGHVHCSSDLDETVALTSAPSVPGIDDAVQLVLGRDFGCVLRRTGAVACFGGNIYGQLGAALRTNASPGAVPVIGITDAKRLVAGDMHACALLADGTVRCWGRNDQGQTGGATSYLPAVRELVTAEPVDGVKDVASLVASGNTTCAKGRVKEVVCWGRALFSTASYTLDGRPETRAPARVEELAPFDGLAANSDAFCGIREGQVSCWGAKASLLKASAGAPAAVEVVDVQLARRVRLGQKHACALLDDGAVTCWGTAASGALGRGELTGDAIRGPVVVKGLPVIADLALGELATCAIGGAPAHEVYCWGTWPHGSGTERKHLVPIKIRVAP